MEPGDAFDLQGARGLRRRIAITAILAAVIAALLGGLQTYFANAEQRAITLAGRRAVQIFTQISGSSPFVTFAAQSAWAAAEPEIRALAREYVALDASAAAGGIERDQARADHAAAVQAEALAAAMTAPPTTADAVDQATRQTLLATEDDWKALLAEQNRLVDAAGKAGDKANLVVVALSLTAIAAALVSLSGALRTRRHRAALLDLGSAFLLVAVLCGTATLLP
jgi:hypothetical protein